MGREKEFASFAEHSYPRLLRLGYVLTGDQERAKDLTQETLTRVYVAWPRLRSQESPFAYARATMTNLVRDWHRRRAEFSVAEVPEPMAASAALDFADSRALLDAVRSLEQRERTAIVLRFYEDLPERKVAELMGFSVGALKSLTHRAMTKLRNSYVSALSPVDGRARKGVDR